MNKCQHGVRIPEGDFGTESKYCSGCTTPDPLPEGATKEKVFTSPFPYGDKVCPVCQSRRGFKYVSQWDWNCVACGADSLNN